MPRFFVNRATAKVHIESGCPAAEYPMSWWECLGEHRSFNEALTRAQRSPGRTVEPCSRCQRFENRIERP